MGERIAKEESHLLCALFCLSCSFIHLSILAFALPVKNATLSMSPPPSLSLLFKDKKHKKRKKAKGMEALGLSYPFSMVGGWLLARGPSPCFSICLLSPYLLGSFDCSQTEKESEFLSFSLFFLWVFVSKGNEQERRKRRKRGKMKTSTIFSLPWAMERLCMWIVFCIFKREKGRPRTKALSLCLYPCRYLSFFRYFFILLSFPVPISISHSFIPSLTLSLSISLSLSLSLSLYLSLSLSMCDGSRRPFYVFCVFKPKRKTSQKITLRGVPFARLKTQKAIKGTPFWIGSKPS